jgi:sorting nexin-8
MIKRREAAAVRVPPATTRKTFIPAHLGLPSFSSSSLDNTIADHASLSSSVFSGLMHPRWALDSDSQADTARLTNALRVVVEVNAKCWRGDGCELCSGVRQGVSSIAAHTQQHGDALEHRVRISFRKAGDGMTEHNCRRAICSIRHWKR